MDFGCAMTVPWLEHPPVEGLSEQSSRARGLARHGNDDHGGFSWIEIVIPLFGLSNIWNLVGGIINYPSEKWWTSSVGMMTFPIYGNIKFMFQTTNQQLKLTLWLSNPLLWFLQGPVSCKNFWRFTYWTWWFSIATWCSWMDSEKHC